MTQQQYNEETGKSLAERRKEQHNEDRRKELARTGNEDIKVDGPDVPLT